MERKEQNAGFDNRQPDDRDQSWEREYQAELGGSSVSTFRQIRTTVAGKLQAAAQTLHQKAARFDQPNDLSDFGHRAAGWLERSAQYVNEIEPQRVKSDLASQVRRNPGRSLLIAGAVGLVLGRLLRRR